MSFDCDPDDKEKRVLGYHSESDSYFVCQSHAELASYGPECDDVTGVDHHEEEYSKRDMKEWLDLQKEI